MALTEEQIRQYNEEGFVVLEGLFSPDEVRLLREDADILKSPQRGHPDANVYEKDGKTIRAAWAVEKDSNVYAMALRLAKVLGPVRQILGNEIYLYQSRLNFKIAGRGDVFQWHTDYASWEQDGVPRGSHHDMLSVLIMLDDTRPESGPLRFVPRSHKDVALRSDYDTQTTSYALHVVPDAQVEELLGGKPPVECLGPAGTAVIFSGSLVHGSQQNRSEQDRRNLYFAYNRCDNLPVGRPRRKHANGYIMNDDTSRLEITPEPVLRRTATAPRPSTSSARPSGAVPAEN
jgi:ectoine hydroxylase